MTEIQQLGVVGAGTMGSQIAAQAALTGIDVVLVDSDDKILVAAADSNRKHLSRRVEKGTLPAGEAEAALARIRPSTTFQALAGCQLVIEAVFEDRDVKQEVFSRLAEVCAAETILASNSSTLPISTIFDGLPNPDRACNLHFFHPVLVMKLVEIMRGPETSESTVAACETFVRRIGREPVVIEREVSGLIVNRVLAAIKREALWLAAEGYATPVDIDKAVKLGLNHPMGPFELTDFSGLDVFHNIMTERYRESGDEAWRPPALLTEKIDAGHLGRKSGKGFYDYSEK